MFSILRAWGMCIAVPVGGSIVLTQMVQELYAGGSAAEPSGSLTRKDGIVLTPDNRQELGHLFLGSFGVWWRFFMGASALGGLSSLMI
ncbi:hypothetical protein BDV11DRAFT_54409 [Aspergillus similis]